MRLTSDWIEGYLKYMENTESARIFHKWTAMSIIAACLRKKVRLPVGRINIYPNLYVVFVGPPGGPRKSQAISFGINKFLKHIPDVVLSAEAITPQALIQELERATADEIMPDGSILQHASLTVTSREFESFLGQKAENTKMITYLTDLFDAQEDPWEYKTKHSGVNVIPSPFLNLLAATTPESVANFLPSSAIGSGLTSRILFIWADKKDKKVAFPVETEEELLLKEKLLKDLHVIARLAGTYQWSEQARSNWEAWYQLYDANSEERICADPAFTGWYERKPLYVLKVAMIRAAAQSDELVLRWSHIEKSLSDIEEAEATMRHVFRAVGRSPVAADIDLVAGIIRLRGWIREDELFELIWRDVDSSKFDNVIDTLIRRGIVRKVFKGPDGQPGLWYKYAGKRDE